MHTDTQRIMVVDDEADILWVVQRALEKYGFTVEAFSDASKALDYFSASPQDFILVITDVRMPGMNGFELAQNVWRVRPETKVLFMTAHLAEEMNNVSHAIYEHNVIEKPFTIQVLCNEVKLRLPATT